MKTSLFVISDLHLGGGHDFQMCSPVGRKRLAEFISYGKRGQVTLRHFSSVSPGVLPSKTVKGARSSDAVFLIRFGGFTEHP